MNTTKPDEKLLSHMEFVLATQYNNIEPINKFDEKINERLFFIINGVGSMFDIKVDAVVNSIHPSLQICGSGTNGHIKSMIDKKLTPMKKKIIKIKTQKFYEENTYEYLNLQKYENSDEEINLDTYMKTMYGNNKSYHFGTTVISPDFGLNNNYFIHTIAPSSEKDLKSGIKLCIDNMFSLCEKGNLESVAIPCLSTETFSLSQKGSAEAILSAVYENMEKNTNIKVIIQLFKSTEVKTYTELVTKYFPLNNFIGYNFAENSIDFKNNQILYIGEELNISDEFIQEFIKINTYEDSESILIGNYRIDNENENELNIAYKNSENDVLTEIKKHNGVFMTSSDKVFYKTYWENLNISNKNNLYYKLHIVFLLAKKFDINKLTNKEFIKEFKYIKYLSLLFNNDN